MSVIMVVDDMAVVREPIAAALWTCGYETLCFSDGSHALQALALRTPDLVLLDLSMPGMSGLDLLRALRERPATAHASHPADCLVRQGAHRRGGQMGRPRLPPEIPLFAVGAAGSRREARSAAHPTAPDRPAGIVTLSFGAIT